MLRLIDYFVSWRGNGIFKNLGNWTPWANDPNVSVSALDWEYFGNRSGYKCPSPLLVKILPPYRVLSVEQITEIAEVIRTLFETKWTKLYTAFNLNYKIGDNVDLTETNNNVQHKAGKTEDDGDVDTKIESSGTNTNSVVPFGSSANTYVEVNKQEAEAETSGTKSYNKTHRKSENDDWQTDDRTKTLKGKTGGVDYTKAVDSEIALRQKAFFDIIMGDMDSVLTIPYWG